MPQISIIVPVYKVEDYLPRCIESILLQSFTDYELLLVDDGSPDSCGKICDDYSKLDSRIRVFHKDNGGVSSARNIGIENARGDFLSFVDSDDFVSDRYLTDLMEHEEDLICQTAKVVSDDGLELFTPSHTEFEVSNIEFDEGLFTNLLLEGVFNWIHCKRFRTSIIRDNSLRFDTSLDFAEDTLFVVQYSRFIHSICVENKANYRYVVYKTRNTLSNVYSRDRIEVLKKANRLITSCLSTNEIDQMKLYNQRMVAPYAKMVAQKERQYGRLFRVFYYFTLQKDKDFLRVLSSDKSAFSFPEKLRDAILNQNKSRIILEYNKWLLKRFIRKISGCLGD